MSEAIKEAFDRVKDDLDEMRESNDKRKKEVKELKKQIEDLSIQLSNQTALLLAKNESITKREDKKEMENVTENKSDDDKSMKELLIEMKDKMGETKKEKKWKLPFVSKLNNSKAKANWVTVIQILDNRELKFSKQQVDEQTIMLDGTPRMVTPDEVLTYKGRPAVIVPSWSVKPFSPTDNYKDTIALGYASQGHKLILNKLQKEAIMAKKSIGGLGWIIGGLAVLGLGYYAWKAGYLGF